MNVHTLYYAFTKELYFYEFTICLALCPYIEFIWKCKEMIMKDTFFMSEAV